MWLLVSQWILHPFVVVLDTALWLPVASLQHRGQRVTPSVNRLPIVSTSHNSNKCTLHILSTFHFQNHIHCQIHWTTALWLCCYSKHARSFWRSDRPCMRRLVIIKGCSRMNLVLCGAEVMPSSLTVPGSPSSRVQMPLTS